MARPRILTPCPRCNVMLSAREHRAHKCAVVKPVVMETCRKCGGAFRTVDFPDHPCLAAMSRESLIQRIMTMVANGEAGYRIGRQWGKQRLEMSLRDRLQLRSTTQLIRIAEGRGGTASHNTGRCIICSHPEREAIEQALRDGVSYREVGRRWGMNKQSVARHVDHKRLVG